MTRPAILVLVRHGQSERNVAKKHNRFYLDDEARKAVKGVPDHLIPLTDEGRRQATLTGLAIRDAFGAFGYVFGVLGVRRAANRGHVHRATRRW